jgi:hypothetical protein
LPIETSLYGFVALLPTFSENISKIFPRSLRM